MVRLRSRAGHQAKLLRSILQERVEVTKGQQQSRIIRAIGLCDAFLNSCNSSTAALSVLEQEVIQALNAKNQQRSLPVLHSEKMKSGGEKISLSHSEAKESSEIDCTMPADLRLERKAFTKPIGFAQVAKRQDEIAMQDDVKRAENKALFIARTRQLLDGQMKELSAQREAEARSKQHASRMLADEVKQYQQELRQQQIAKRSQQKAVRDRLQAQIHETQRQRDAAAAEAARVSRLERERLELEARDEEASRKQKRMLDQKKNQAFVRSMMQALDRKRAQAEEAKAAERRYNDECIKRMDAEQVARDAAVVERKAKLEKAFRQGGGEALSASLAEKALADEQRAAAEQEAYAAKQLAREQETQRQRDIRNRQQVSGLKAQMEEKRHRVEVERQEAAAFGAKAIADVEAMKQQVKANKAAARAQKAADLERLKTLFIRDQKRRYQQAQDAVPEDHAWLHKKVVEGTSRGFMTLPSLYPSV